LRRLRDITVENRKRQRTILTSMKHSDPNAASKLLSDIKSKTMDEEYKSHSKTHASIGKPTTTQYSRNFYKPTTEASGKQHVNSKLSRMYEKMEKQYFRKLGMLG